MAINGIMTLRYRVGNVATCGRFFDDFGLTRSTSSDLAIAYSLEEGSAIELHGPNSPIPSGAIDGDGVHEVVWGVSSAEALARLSDNLARDHDMRPSADGAVRFVPSFGIPMALQVFAKKTVASAPEPVNAPGHVARLNSHRKWRKRARPKVLQHVVFQTPQFEAATAFMRDRLGFRVTDIQDGFGVYLRAPGTINHHNFLLLNANAALPGCDGKTRFHHANFGVEDLDEIMLGANHMQRRGWQPSAIGLGRHRIDSALFYYLPCPAGGEAEYGADSDYVDDNWVPRRWTLPLFGYAHFTHNLPHFLMQAPEWRYEYADPAG